MIMKKDPEFLTFNYPFLDGNKRTALTSALVFLIMNNYEVKDPQQHFFAGGVED